MLYDLGLDIPDSLQTDKLAVSFVEDKLRISLRARAKDRTAVQTLTGLKLPRKIGDTHQSADMLIACLGPEEWLIIADPNESADLLAELLSHAKDQLMSVTDVSHRNVGFIVDGAASRALINVGCPLDLRDTDFPVGKFTRTVFESAPITLYRENKSTYVIECWRSFAPYLRDFFVRAASDV